MLYSELNKVSSKRRRTWAKNKVMPRKAHTASDLVINEKSTLYKCSSTLFPNIIGITDEVTII